MTTNRADNVRQAILFGVGYGVKATYDRMASECQLHFGRVEDMPAENCSGRCAIAYFDDDSRLEFSDANPLGNVTVVGACQGCGNLPCACSAPQCPQCLLYDDCDCGESDTVPSLRVEELDCL